MSAPRGHLFGYLFIILTRTHLKFIEKDFKVLVEKDLEMVKKKLQQEKEDFENKAKKFLDSQKKELATLQTRIDNLVKATSQLKNFKKHSPSKGTAKSAASKKSVIKKVSKATSKPGFKPNTTKKAVPK